MADFNVPESPVFEEKIRQLETTDPAHASVFNNILVKLFHNDVFNRKKQQEHEVNKQNPHKITPTQIGAATVDALDMAYQNGNAYTDSKIADLINGAPNTMDTLKEISDAMAANKTVVDALEDSIGSKAPKAELDTHVTNKTLHITAAERTKWNTVDTALSGTSTNPIQNKVVKAAFDQQNVKNSSLEGSIAEVNSNLGGNVLITEGSGVNAKYYIQVGADTASKKLLGGNVTYLTSMAINEGASNYIATCKKYLVFVCAASGNVSRGSVSVAAVSQTTIVTTLVYTYSNNGTHTRSGWGVFLVVGNIGDTIRINSDGSYGAGGASIVKIE